jgi:predicted Holliday junction resolvase-like endonuclease
MTVADPLGPFQDFWKVWNEVDADLRDKPISHFRRAIEVQFEELEEHLQKGNRDKAAREAIDTISIALNLLRKLGYQPEEIAQIARLRADQRMKGRVAEILEKYQEKYGI